VEGGDEGGGGWGVRGCGKVWLGRDGWDECDESVIGDYLVFEDKTFNIS
jgi:hypothetical protein